MISVIIVTRNRSNALETISLPSLAKQDFKDFEIIIWDGSDKDDSKKVVEEFSKKNPFINIKWYKELRKGITSSRNDAVKVAKGDIIFFIDDDSEISSDGIRSISNEFDSKSDVTGIALPIKESRFKSSHKHKVARYLFHLYRRFFMLGIYNSKKTGLYLSGLPKDAFDVPGKTDHLKGCGMAFRKETFLKNKFEEGLQKFGGYALFEDLQFTQKLYREGKKLLITNKGYIIHHGVEEGTRFVYRDSNVAATIYNHFVVWQSSVYPYKKFSIIFFLWSLLGRIILFSLLYVVHPKKNVYILRGIKMGLKAILSKVHLKNQ